MPKAKAVNIRQANRVDKKTIAGIYATCFDAAWAVAAVDDLLKGKGCWAFILDCQKPDSEDHAAVGFVLGRSVLDEAEILSIGVNPAFQGQGFAKKLMTQAMSEAKVRHGEKMFLEVAEDNGAARALYKKLGFQMIGRRKNYYLKADRSRVDALNLSAKLT